MCVLLDYGCCPVLKAPLLWPACFCGAVVSGTAGASPQNRCCAAGKLEACTKWEMGSCSRTGAYLLEKSDHKHKCLKCVVQVLAFSRVCMPAKGRWEACGACGLVRRKSNSI